MKGLVDEIKSRLDSQPLITFINNHSFIPKGTKVIYQYTHWDALFHGILDGSREKNKEVCIRATNCRYLNDPKEICLGSRLSQEILDVSLKHGGASADINLEKFFVTSFSERRDYLPMWSMYGKNGTGLSVGFDVAVLSQSKLTTFGRCMYCDTEFLESFRNFNEHNNVQPPTTEEISQMSTEDIGKVTSHAYFLLVDALQKVLALSKTPEYAYEKEIRICMKTTKNVQFRNTGKMIVPYIDMFFPKAVVKEIIVGPTNEGKRAVDSLKEWLQSIGMEFVQVSLSEVPYRQ